MSMQTPCGSVVIPAHNESNVIHRCLDALLAEFDQREIEVVVVCNGCTDGTAEVARTSGHRIDVLEIHQASKIAALRAGEAVLRAFPRMYLDADVVLPSASARAVIERLQHGPVLAARPPLHYSAENSSRLVRSYYRARERTPAVMGALWGAGVYGLSQAGRSRFSEFPEVIADDLFVDGCFRRSEIEVVDCEPVVVHAPRRSADLIRIMRRNYRGNAENQATAGNSRSTASSTLRDLAKSATAGPAQALDAVTYASMAIATRLALTVADSSGWERDESSREAER